MPALYNRSPLRFKLPDQNGGEITGFDVFPGLNYYDQESDLVVSTDSYSSVYSPNFNIYSSVIAPKLVQYVPSLNAFSAEYYKGVYIYNPSIEKDGVTYESSREDIVFSITGGSSFTLSDISKVFYEQSFYGSDVFDSTFSNGVGKTSVNSNISIDISPSVSKNIPLEYFEIDGSTLSGTISGRTFFAGNSGILVPRLDPGDYFGLYLRINALFSIDSNDLDYSFFNLNYSNVDYPDGLFGQKDYVPGKSVLGVLPDKNYILVGASYGDTAYENSGLAYLFDSINGQTLSLTPSDASTTNFFGVDVAIASDLIVVGANGVDDNGIDAGAIYLFDFSGNEIAKIQPTDVSLADNFGKRLAVGYGKIIVGVENDDPSGLGSGSAYVFDYSGNELLKLVPGDGDYGDGFGSSVSINSQNIFIGADKTSSPEDFVTFNGSTLTYQNNLLTYGSSSVSASDSSGSVYIFDYDGTEIIKFNSSDSSSGDLFGFSVDVTEEIVVVGAPGVSSGVGSAYVFDTSGNESYRLSPPVSANLKGFGVSCASFGTRIAVGAYTDTTIASDAGAVYLFNSEGVFLRKIAPSGLSENSYFGIDVDMDDSVLVVGSLDGSVYVFDTEGNEISTFSASDSSLGDSFGQAISLFSEDINYTQNDYFIQSFALKFNTNLTEFRRRLGINVDFLYDNYPPFFADYRESE